MRYLKKISGFTLLEVMLVIFLMGIAATYIVFTAFGTDQGEELAKQAKRFEVVVSMASDYAVLNQQQLGVRIDKQDNRYVFLMLDEEQIWRELDQDKMFAAYQLPDDFSLQLSLDDLPWQQQDSLFSDGIFDEESSFSKDVVQIGDEEDKLPDPPQILLLSSGEITPFSVSFSYEPNFADDQPRYFRINAEDSLPLKREGPLDNL